MTDRKMPDPYALADSVEKVLNRRALDRADKLKRKLVRLKFDELNVLEEFKTLYADLDDEFRNAVEKLYTDRYNEMWLWLKGRDQDEDIVDELVEMRLAGFFDTPNATTHYIWSAEVTRKRDRAIEAVWASPSKMQKQLEIDKAIRYWIQMSNWYADFASQDAEIQALKDSGSKRVKRHERMDDRVCDDCRVADGEIYDIDDIPDAPHPRCRRWFTPVSSTGKG